MRKSGKKKRKAKRKKNPTHKKCPGFNSYIRMLIRERADGKCQFPECNNTGSQCHHIVARSVALNKYGWNTSRINALDNGIYLCRRCHERIHRNFEWKSLIPKFKTIIAQFASYN